MDAGGARAQASRDVEIYLLMALCLHPDDDDDYEEVAEKLTGMLAMVPGARWQAPTRGDYCTQARQRLRSEIVQEVFGRVARPAATVQSMGTRLGRWRVMAGCLNTESDVGRGSESRSASL